MADPEDDLFPKVSDDEAPSSCEDISEIPDVIELKFCCRCSQMIETGQEVFDTDSCAHHVCQACRFKEDLNCSVCNPHCEREKNESNDKIPTNVLQSYAVGMKRNKITPQHIVNVEWSAPGGFVQRQMCSVCQRVFKSTNARYHYTCASGDKPFACDVCEKKFVKKSHLEAHLYNHYGIKPYKCTFEKCTASFAQKDKLVRHMKGHNNEKYLCVICDKSYKSQDILHHHMDKVHTSAKPFQCDLCPRSYKYKKSLKLHRLKHQAIREHMCEICGKKYSLCAQLKYHKRSHITYNRRPYKCVCGRRFMTKQGKARHQITHNSSRDFECSLCNTTFGRKDNLERHMKNFHEDNLPKSRKVAKLTAVVSPFNKSPPVAKNNKLSQNKNNIQNTANKPNTDQKLIKSKHKMEQPKDLQESKSVLLDKKSSKKLTVNIEDCAVEKHMEERDKPISTVIVSPNLSENQQRPSVIKSIPKLLPYRILQPDKRLLMSTDESNCGKSPSDLMPPPVLKRISDIPKPKRVITHKPKVPKDDALNRCFRIIHHTSSVQQPIKNSYSTEKLVQNINAVLNRPVDILHNEKSHESSRISVPNLFIPNTLDQGLCRLTGDDMPLSLSSLDSSKCLGGPTLPTSFPEALDAGDANSGGDSFSYTPLGESSCSTYTPYFDSDCFRDGENNCYEDFDMGFQYISEHFSHAEINLSTETKSVKYVSQETIMVKNTSFKH